MTKTKTHSLRPGADDRADGARADRSPVHGARGDRRLSDGRRGRRAGLLRPRRQGDPGGGERRRHHEARRRRRRGRSDVRSLAAELATEADGRVHAALRRALRPAGPARHAADEAASSGREGPGRRHRLHHRRQGLDRHQLPRRRQGRLDHRHPDRRPQAAGQADGRRREDRPRPAQGRERQAAAVRHASATPPRCASARR